MSDIVIDHAAIFLSRPPHERSRGFPLGRFRLAFGFRCPMCYISIMCESLKTSGFLILLLVLASLAGGCTVADTPRRSLDEMRNALLKHDADAALRYVDMDSVVENMVRDIFAKYEAKSDDPLALLGVKAGRQVASVLMPGVKAFARNRVKEAIISPDEGGYFST